MIKFEVAIFHGFGDMTQPLQTRNLQIFDNIFYGPFFIGKYGPIQKFNSLPEASLFERWEINVLPMLFLFQPFKKFYFSKSQK